MRPSVECDSFLPFLSFSWYGDGRADFDNVWDSSGNSMSGTGYMDPRSGSGSFEIRTQDSCDWTITVTQRY